MNTIGSGWTCCPSVERPGMFYYYNTLTGESVWSLHDHPNTINPVASTNSFSTLIDETCEALNRFSLGNEDCISHHSCSDVVEKLNSLSIKYDSLRANIMTGRFTEWTCSYLQIMEHFLHDILQVTEGTKFQPPCWFLQGLKCFRQVFAHHRTVSRITELLLFMSGYCAQNGIVRTRIRSNQFIKLLCGGILLVDEFLNYPGNIDVLAYKYMLQELIESIRHPITASQMQAIDVGYLGKSGYQTTQMMRIMTYP